MFLLLTDYITKKSGAQASSGMFSQLKSEWSATSSGGHVGFFHNIGGGHGRGGSSSSSFGNR